MSSMHGIPFEKHSTIHFGLIGAGGRGTGMMNEFLAVDGVEIIAIADVSKAATEKAAQGVINAGKKAPGTYSGENAVQEFLKEDLDFVYIATPWDTHTRYAVAAMQSGAHVGIEVPAAVTIDECWQLVNTSEQTRKHCIMLENCCYDYWEMLTKNMVEAGKLGTITHAEAAYIHDLREVLFENHSEGLWRRHTHMDVNGNLYATHGLGPVAQILGIGETDAFDYMVSMSSLSAGLYEYREQNLSEEDPRNQEHYACGDMNTSLIRTKSGRTIVLQHDVVNPRVYDRNFLISGTRGSFRAEPPRLYLDGVGKHEQWLPIEDYQEEWEHPLWKELGELARSHGHGGMDFIMVYRLVQLLKDGLAPDMDVYDAADWSAPGPLSVESVAKGACQLDSPDFRRKQA